MRNQPLTVPDKVFSVPATLIDTQLLELSHRVVDGLRYVHPEDRQRWVDMPGYTSQAVGLLLSTPPEQAVARLLTPWPTVDHLTAFDRIRFKASLLGQSRNSQEITRIYSSLPFTAEDSWQFPVNGFELLAGLEKLGIAVTVNYRRELQDEVLSTRSNMRTKRPMTMLDKVLIQGVQLVPPHPCSTWNEALRKYEVTTLVKLLDWLLDIAITGLLINQEPASYLKGLMSALPTGEVRLHCSDTFALEGSPHVVLIYNKGAEPDGPWMSHGNIELSSAVEMESKLDYALLV